MIRGFDASSCQGRLDCEAAKAADLEFVILKAQQGNDGFDPLFVENAEAAEAAGLVAFPYVFAYPLPAKAGGDGRDPREQARLCVERVYAHAPWMRGRPFFVDLEWPAIPAWLTWGCSPEQISEWCRIFCEEITRLIEVDGGFVVIYTYPDWWLHVSKADTSWAAAYANWLARYVKAWPVEGQGPKLIKPWTTWLFWQWDGDGGCKLPNGVDADFCVFNGTLEELRALAPKVTPEQSMTDPATVHPPVYSDGGEV